LPLLDNAPRHCLRRGAWQLPARRAERGPCYYSDRLPATSWDDISHSIVRILIADDDALSRGVLEATLRRLGHETVVVTNGTDALDELLRPHGPRLAILDWMMPGPDGLAVCRAVRERVGPYVYVVLLTARDRHEDMIAALDADVDDFLTKPLDPGELQARLRSGQRLLALQENLLQAQEALRYQATHDDLTGLWNRAMVRDHLTIELSRAKREGKPLAVALADLDHFKKVNDTLGHSAGDAILREAAARIRGALRAYDSLGRYGGEEFLIVLPNCDADAAVVVAERARDCVATPMHVGAVDVPLSISVGVASTTTAAEDPDSLIQAADDALYRAKAAGRNRVSV
jgi:two-component system, cell cycle response regulator